MIYGRSSLCLYVNIWDKCVIRCVSRPTILASLSDLTVFYFSFNFNNNKVCVVDNHFYFLSLNNIVVVRL
jgi:hypothetical protein